MDDAPPRYDNDPTPALPSSTGTTGTADLTTLTSQITHLQTQITTLLALQHQQQSLLAQRLSLIPDPPIYNGKGWFKEWHWKMTGKLRELDAQSVDETTKIEYLVSRLTENAFLTVDLYLQERLKMEVRRWAVGRQLETADEIMRVLKNKYS